MDDAMRERLRNEALDAMYSYANARWLVRTDLALEQQERLRRLLYEIEAAAEARGREAVTAAVLVAADEVDRCCGVCATTVRTALGKG